MPVAKKKSKLILKIMPDPDPMNPREWDNETIMVCWHRHYTLGDKHQFSSPKELRQFLAKTITIHRPLYMIDHSGLCINMTGFADCDPQGRDWGQLGVIMATESLIEEFKDLSRKEYTSKILDIFNQEIETYNDYLQGNVWGYQIMSVCPTCGQEDEIIDSCWGFYGLDPKENGIYDCLPAEFQNRIDAGEEFFCY